MWSVSLQKLWFFLTSVLSFSICSWRIVLSKYGDVGFHELKGLFYCTLNAVNDKISSQFEFKFEISVPTLINNKYPLKKLF